MYSFMTIAAVLASAVLAVPASGQILSNDLKLLPDDGAEGDEFGHSIAIADGVVAVGARTDGNSGSAYLFDASTGAQLAGLLPDDGDGSDQFGWSIAIADGIVAVGAHSDDDNGTNSGSAYLFDAATGAQLAKLLPDDGAEGAEFGYSIAIADGIVAVGARFDDDSGIDSGSAYLFDASTGAQLAKLLPDDGAEGAEFGSSIAIADGIVAVGAPLHSDSGPLSGSAYLFDASTGVQLAKLLAADGASSDQLGWSIAIAGGVVAVGARFDDDNGSASGSAYLFSASTGVQLAKLLAADGASSDQFGWSIAIADGVVAVGARGHSDNGFFSGAAYLFDASTGAQIAELLADDGDGMDQLGWSIAIADGLVAAGAYFDDDNGFASGSAYVFDTNPCSAADLAFPPGALDFDDVLVFLAAFSSMDPVADLAEPFGVFGIDDVLAFLAAFDAGCP